MLKQFLNIFAVQVLPVAILSRYVGVCLDLIIIIILSNIHNCTSEGIINRDPLQKNLGELYHLRIRLVILNTGSEGGFGDVYPDKGTTGSTQIVCNDPTDRILYFGKCYSRFIGGSGLAGMRQMDLIYESAEGKEQLQVL